MRTMNSVELQHPVVGGMESSVTVAGKVETMNLFSPLQPPQPNIYHVDFKRKNTLLLQEKAPIRIYTLGYFSLTNGDKNLLGERQASEKPLELLKALIAQGGRNVGVVRLCEALWPEVDGDVAHSSFSVTLHRLRKIMGKEALILEGNRLSLNPEQCWVDIWHCEYLLKELDFQFTWSHQDEAYVMNLVNDLNEVYTGPFLGTEDENSWGIMCRDRLHTKFLRVIMAVCGYFEKSGKCERALTFYHKAIEMDPCAENVYYRLMNCYLASDRKAEAMVSYLQCERVLRATLNVEPSTRIKALYRSISRA